AQHIYRVAMAHYDDENMSRRHGFGVPRREVLKRVIITLHAREAGAGSLVKGHTELHARDRVHEGFVEILHSLDEVALAQNEVAVRGNLQRHEFQFHMNHSGYP